MWINGRSSMAMLYVISPRHRRAQRLKPLLAPKQLDAIRKLHHTLSLSSPSLSPHPFPITLPSPESHLRAPCATDSCLFSTSLTPFPSPSQLSHPPSSLILPSSASFLSRLVFGNSRSKARGEVISEEDGGRFNPLAIEHVREVEERFNAFEGGWPSDDWWVKSGSWHLAVDGLGRKTCWESWRREFRVPRHHVRVIADVSSICSSDSRRSLWTAPAEAENRQRDRADRIDGSGECVDVGRAWTARGLAATDDALKGDWYSLGNMTRLSQSSLSSLTNGVALTGFTQSTAIATGDCRRRWSGPSLLPPRQS